VFDNYNDKGFYSDEIFNKITDKVEDGNAEYSDEKITIELDNPMPT